MFNFNNKRNKIVFWGGTISLITFLIVFSYTDRLTGDKGFSEYTYDDWRVAMLPLVILIISGASTLVFYLLMFIPFVRIQPAIKDYVSNKKFSEFDLGTEFLVFDHNELKRACCRTESIDRIWFSVKDFDLKSRSWITLEKGRCVDSIDDLNRILQEDYSYDELKFFYLNDVLEYI